MVVTQIHLNVGNHCLLQKMVKLANVHHSAFDFFLELVIAYFFHNIKKTFEEADKNGDGLLNIEEIYQLMHKLNVNLPRRKVRQMFQEADTDENQGTLTFEEFCVFYKMMSLRRDLYLLLLSYSDKKDHLTVDDLAQFLKVEQKMNNVTTEYCLDIIQKFEVSEENKEQNVLGIEGFTSFMRSPAGDIFNPLHSEIYQDMEQPLSHYYIASSHNTYLTGDQLLSQSKVDMYAWVLQDGCRCIEVDCWDGPDGEPVVHHGYTLTSKIPFKDVVETINKYAFVKNDYPVILSIENHCNIQQQRKIAQYLKEIFGDKLDLSSVPFGENKQLPSPQSLKGKILVKGKKLPYDLAEDVEEGEVSDEDSADEIEEECKLSNCFSNGTTEHQVESFIRKKLESLLKESQIRDKEDPDSFTVRALLKATHEGLNVNLKQNSDTKDRGKSKRSSMGNIGKHKRTSKSRSKSCSTDEEEDSSPRESEKMHRLGRRRKTMKLCRALSDLVVYTNSVAAQDIMDDGSTGNVLSFSETRAHQVVQQKSEQFMSYNQKQLTRIYPSAYRIDSSNFNPVPYWNAGIQLVALNYQTEGRMMELNRAKFKVNGNCGYVLKPPQMCKGVFNPFSGDPLPASPKKQLILKVISGQQLPKPPDSMLGDRGEIIDPYVEIEMIGLPVDCCKEQTRVVDDNGFNPVWEETLTFTVHMPEIALVRFLVWDHDPIGRDFVGQRTVAFSSLLPGYRHVYLEGLTEASIFVHVTINEIYGKNRQFIGLKGLFTKGSKHGSVESNGHIRKRSIGDRILRRTASAPAKGRKKTKMVFQESTESKDLPCEVSGAKVKDVVMRRTSRSLQARPVSMPVDKLVLGAFEPSTSETSKDNKTNYKTSGKKDCKSHDNLLLEEQILENSKKPACLPRVPYQANTTTNENIIHKKWQSLHLDYGKHIDDDVREFNDTYTSESEDEKDEVKQSGYIMEDIKPKVLSNSNAQAGFSTKETQDVKEFPSITNLSSTICTDANNLQATPSTLENDISQIINEVPSVNESELDGSISALIGQFETTDDRVSLTYISSSNCINSNIQCSGYSEINLPSVSTPKKMCPNSTHVDKLLQSAIDTKVFSRSETAEYSIYTIINEENLLPENESQGVSHSFPDKDLNSRSSSSSFQHSHSGDSYSKKMYQAPILNANVSKQGISNTFDKEKHKEFIQLNQYKHHDQYPISEVSKTHQYGAHRGSLHVPCLPKYSNCSTQETNQTSPCKSKSLGDLTSEDISCNFDSKYKRINRGFLLSGNAEDTKHFAKTKHQSTDALTEQLRKLVSYDQEDSNKSSYCEEDEWDKPKPLARKLSSRSQSRVRNIANRAKERQEANKLKQVNQISNGVVLRNKPPTSSQPVNRHSTGSYIAGSGSNFNLDSLDGRGIPEGACSSQTYGHSDLFCRNHFTYQTEPCNTDEPEVYFLLRL
uniref:Phosphoinositide phospholipase C n=1 Tax=Pyxicephalus adspersus TaxID=30357 RepID=A0AAV3AM57_PYXAD|nr:TPA: hypothetical protein GDO54_010403 [Pyxicephalus adspersus]